MNLLSAPKWVIVSLQLANMSGGGEGRQQKRNYNSFKLRSRLLKLPAHFGNRLGVAMATGELSVEYVLMKAGWRCSGWEEESGLLCCVCVCVLFVYITELFLHRCVCVFL